DDQRDDAVTAHGGSGGAWASSSVLKRIAQPQGKHSPPFTRSQHPSVNALGIGTIPGYRPTPTQKRAVTQGEDPLATGSFNPLPAGPVPFRAERSWRWRSRTTQVLAKRSPSTTC